MWGRGGEAAGRRRGVHSFTMARATWIDEVAGFLVRGGVVGEPPKTVGLSVRGVGVGLFRNTTVPKGRAKTCFRDYAQTIPIMFQQSLQHRQLLA